MDCHHVDVHLLKQHWCALLSLAGGGTLLPSQIRRIAQESSVKLPARFLSNEYVNAVICCQKGQLSIYPASVTDLLFREWTPSILSEKEEDFKQRLAEYREILTDEEE